MAQLFWPKMPVILEHEHYGNAIKRGSWDKELLLKSVEHASYMSIHWWPRVLLDENRIYHRPHQPPSRLPPDSTPRNVARTRSPRRGVDITSEGSNTGVALAVTTGLAGHYTLKLATEE